MKLTGWFSGTVKPMPDRPGVYRTRTKMRVEDRYDWVSFWSYWDGKCWSLFEESKKEALRWGHVHMGNQNKSWQGVLR